MTDERKSYGLWEKTGKQGNIFWAGSATTPKGEQVDITLFMNNNKLSNKSPDFNVFIKPPYKKDEQVQQARQFQPENENIPY